jgi:hypothetical protein
MSKRLSLAVLGTAVVLLSLQALHGSAPLLSDHPAAIDRQIH